mmetsp:Transcript_28706/g.48489  ORF Transcript_28706/g.48489 Transcript_28706/m.48489 type:complete len:90 (+) Transcript_28706:5-274(+)
MLLLIKLGISGKILCSDLCDLATSSNYSNFNLSVEIVKTEYLSELRQKNGSAQNGGLKAPGDEMRRKLACTDNANVQASKCPQRSSYTR